MIKKKMHGEKNIIEFGKRRAIPWCVEFGLLSAADIPRESFTTHLMQISHTLEQHLILLLVKIC